MVSGLLAIFIAWALNKRAERAIVSFRSNYQFYVTKFCNFRKPCQNNFQLSLLSLLSDIVGTEILVAYVSERI